MSQSLEIFGPAYETIADELAAILPDRSGVLDAHTHLGLDEDGRSLTREELLAALDEVSPAARACVFPLHDPERHPNYSLPNDRVLQWAAESDGRLYPYCRLDPTEDPVGEAKRCIANGARGIKLHPRAQAFGFGNTAAEAIFATAAEHSVPILIHAGRGMGSMESLVELALRFPEVTLVLAHCGIADQGVFASRLRDHPAVYYDTSVLAGEDVVELYARVPAERIVFASDVPYGRPRAGLFVALRSGVLAGLNQEELQLLAGGRMRALLEGNAPEPIQEPRLPRVRPVNGSLLRLAGYLRQGFGALIAIQPIDLERASEGIALSRAVCRDPDAQGATDALARIDALLDATEQLIKCATLEESMLVFGLLHAALAIAATEVPA